MKPLPVTMTTDADVKKFIQCAIDGNVEEGKALIARIDHIINRTDSQGRTALHHAVRNDHLDFVNFLLEHNPDVNAGTTTDGVTPLHIACIVKTKKNVKSPSGVGDTGAISDLANAFAMMQRPKQGLSAEATKDTVIAKLLAYRNVDPNKVNKYGQTPLHVSAIYENLDACMALLNFKPEINIEARDNQQMRALHLAASRKDPGVTKELINHSAKLLCQDLNDSTPLHIAAEEGNLKTAQLLLGSCDDTTKKKEMLEMVDRMGNTCLHSAVLNNRSECVVFFIQRGANLSVANKLGRTPLHLAAMVGDSNIIEKIRKEARMKIDLNAQDCDQDTPLHKAASYKDGRALMALLEPVDQQNVKLDIDLNLANNRGCTPFLVAAKLGRVQCINKLLQEQDMKWDMVDTQRKNALCLAAGGNHKDAIIELLSDKRLERLINEGDITQMNPLLIAAKLGHTDVLQCLMKNGAEPGMKNNKGMSALVLAAAKGHLEIVKIMRKSLPMLLFDKDDKINTALHRAAKAGHLRVVLYLIHENSDLSAKNDKSLTPLGSAVVGGWLKCTEALLKAGSDITTTDNNLDTLLHHVCISGTQSIADVLIKRGISLKEIDSDGNSGLDLAIDNRHSHIVETILNKQYTEASPTEWKHALRKRHGHDTPMRKLVREMPEKAEVVLTKCMTMEGNKVTFDYEFVDDMKAMATWHSRDDQTNKSSTLTGNQLGSTDYKKNHVMNVMVESQRLELIDHPLMLALLRKKWIGSTRLLFLSIFGIYCIFLGLLTGYMVAITPPYLENEGGILDSYVGNNVCEKLDAKGRVVEYPVLVAKYFIIVLTAFLIFVEIGQLYQARVSYLTLENLIEWIVFIFTLLLVVDWHQCQTMTGVRLDWQWPLGAIALFLGWLNLIIYIQRFPKYGIYIVMFRDIFSTFAEFFIVYVLFILAFALGFYSLMRNLDPFKSFGVALMKTATMMTGEYEFGDMFLSSTNVHYEVISYLMFLTLTILLSIIIMNLLVGLAVDNIQEIQKQAALTRLKMQVDLVLEVESLMPQFLKLKFSKLFGNCARSACCSKGEKISTHKIQKTVEVSSNDSVDVIDLNEIVCNWLPDGFNQMFGLASDGITKAKVMKALQPETSEMKVLQNETYRIHLQNDKLRSRVKTVESQVNRIMQMLELTLKELKITPPENLDLEDDTIKTGW